MTTTTAKRPARKTSRPAATPEQRAAATEARQEKVAALLAELETGVAALVDGDDWKRMLQAQAAFHTYSFRNTMLIVMQMPDATRVAGYRTWLSLGRQVRKGEKALAVLAPLVGKVATDSDGTERRATKTDTDTTSRVFGFRTVPVFDISQTDGDPLPDVAPVMLDGQAPDGAYDGLVAHAARLGYTVTTDPRDALPHRANGVTHFDGTGRIRLADDLSPAQAVRTLVHEVAHATLHEAEDAREHRGIAEVEAESVAFVVAQSLGMTAGGYSFPYVASWSAGDLKLVQATGDRVTKAATVILTALGQTDQADDTE